jgi:hypothetical protein
LHSFVSARTKFKLLFYFVWVDFNFYVKENSVLELYEQLLRLDSWDRPQNIYGKTKKEPGNFGGTRTKGQNSTAQNFGI